MPSRELKRQLRLQRALDMHVQLGLGRAGEQAGTAELGMREKSIWWVMCLCIRAERRAALPAH